MNGDQRLKSGAWAVEELAEVDHHSDWDEMG